MAPVSNKPRKFSIKSTSSTAGATIRSNSGRSAGAADGYTPSSSKSGGTEKVNTTTSSRRGRQPKKNSKAMPNTFRQPATADQIAERASRGQDVSAYFTGKFTVVRPAQRVNVDLTP